jgi:nucleotide-binding universal stress UspA family protein
MHVVVGFDGSDGSLRALDRAADLGGYGSVLTIVHVLGEGTEPNGTLEVARERLLQRHLTARYLEPHGMPADEIVGAASELGANLIVVGRRDALGGAPGSVSDAVVKRATCDVLVVG